MDNPQYYQPLSAALHAPLVQQSGRPPQPNQYPNYGSHAPPTAHTGSSNTHREEEEEEEEDDDDVEDELDHHDQHHSASGHSSPRTSGAPPSTKYSGSAGTAGNPSSQYHQSHPPDHANSNAQDEKRKPGRPRGSRNRKPRAPPGSHSTKAPANSQHPGFYQYPPPPGGGIPQNQQFYEFQWRALNLCSEFYNAAEELIKAASPMVIAQCYQMGPATKIDPLVLISDAKRVCDTLLANPSQLVGTQPPAIYPPAPSYPTMPPPPAPGTSGSVSSAPPGPVITNPQSFVMSLGNPSMSAQAPPSYYPPPMYPTPAGSRYPTTPYYSYPPQPPAPYYPPPPPQTQSAPPAPPTPTAPPPPPPAPPTSAPATSTGTLSTFNAATGNVAPGGQQGSWSEDETERLRKLAEQSKESGGAQGKGEIDWDWVVHQWGNSRTRHQILLKATSMGLKESTTRGTKRRRGDENTDASHNNPPQPSNLSVPASAPPPPSIQSQPIHSPASTSTPASVAQSVSPAMQPRSQPPPPQSQPATINPARTTTAPTNPQTTPTASNLPWPMPTVAANTPSPVMAHSQPDVQRTGGYYRSRQPPQTTAYGAQTSPPTAAARPTSSQGNTSHPYMYRPNGTTGRRENGA